LAMEFLFKRLTIQNGSPRFVNRGGKGIATPTLQKALWVCLMLWQIAAQAQPLSQSVQITVNVLPPYSTYIQDYASAGRQVQILIRNTTANTQNLRLVGSVTGDNGVLIQTQANYRPPVPLRLAPFENRLLSQADLEGLFDLNQIDVQGMDKNRLYRGYPLPDGNYQLCVKAFDNARNLQLSPDFPLGCSGMFILKSIEPPILISPVDGVEVPATTPQILTFNWTPPVGVSPASINYTLRIVELPNGQIDPNVYIDAIALPKSGLEIKDLRTSVFLYTPQYPPLTVGKRYAWRVQAMDRFGKLNFLNDGKSPVSEFTYGVVDSKFKKPGAEIAQSPAMQLPLPGFQPSSNPLDTLSKKEYVMKTQSLSINCSCKVEVGDQKVDNSTALSSKLASIAGFQMTLLNDVKEDDSGYLNGSGMIPIPVVNSQYAKLRVQLYNVQCNAAGEVIAGTVRAKYSGKADPSLKPNWDKPDYSPTPLTTEQISNMGAFFANQKDMLVSSLKNAKESIGFEVPFGIDKQFGPVKSVIAITNVTFTPKAAFFDANTWLTLPTAPGGFNGIALSGYNLCISPQKPCGEGVLFLAQDTKLSEYAALKGANLVLPANNPVYQPDTTQATYAVFDENGYHHLSAKVGVKPPKLLRASDNAPVEIIFGAYFPTPSFSEWTATLDFPDFYVEGLKDFVFSTNNQKAIYDHSDQPDSYVALLPNNYPEPGQKPGGEWRGLFFPSLSMTLPAVFERADGKKLTVGVQNMIYDNNGFSGKAFAANILDMGDGSLQGWYFAIDTVSVDFLTSKFKSAGVFGRIVLPIFKYKEGSKDGEGMEQSSLWPYSCTLSKDDSKGITYEFKVSPSQDAQVDIWKAKLSILNGTSIKIGNSSGAFNAVATLNAKLSFQITSFFAPGVTVQNMVIQSSGPNYFSPGSINIALASPQKTSGGLPFTLTKPELVGNGANKYRFKFTGLLNLSEAAQFTAEATCFLDFKVGVGANKRPNFDFEKVGAERIKGNKQFVNSTRTIPNTAKDTGAKPPCGLPKRVLELTSPPNLAGSKATTIST
jgi:TANFOR domain-containing protein